MNVRKIHKYVGLLISIQLLLWTVSGLYFSFNKIEKIRGDHYYREVDKSNTSAGHDTVEMISKNNAFSIILEKTFLTPLELEVISESKKGSEYRGRNLPLYKVIAKNIEDTYINVYQNPYSGEILSIRSQSWRIWDFMWGIHIMDWVERDNISNIFLKFFSFLALITSISGIFLFMRK
ncbi:MAG: PepSY domain-containing protein [Hellea sp.]|nr:PepSY domain-containing protein [Hellea sp.]MDG1665556.1 PepSY domain-containing protein [Hellea sp.]MDG2361663.1 PepSY domain-containing protein [Hellea sp.]